MLHRFKTYEIFIPKNLEQRAIIAQKNKEELEKKIIGFKKNLQRFFIHNNM